LASDIVAVSNVPTSVAYAASTSAISFLPP
jgi:hypothetical protein